MKYILLVAGLTAGNFLYQLATGNNYDAALERSYFMAVGCFACWIMNRREPWLN
jgi:hypothetical protein